MFIDSPALSVSPAGLSVYSSESEGEGDEGEESKVDPKTIANAFQGIIQPERGEGPSTASKEIHLPVAMATSDPGKGSSKKEQRSSGEKGKEMSGSRKRSRSPSPGHGSKHHSKGKRSSKGGSASPHKSPSRSSSKGGKGSSPKSVSKRHSHSRSPSHGRTPKGSETRWALYRVGVGEEGSVSGECQVLIFFATV